VGFVHDSNNPILKALAYAMREIFEEIDQNDEEAWGEDPGYIEIDAKEITSYVEIE